MVLSGLTGVSHNGIFRGKNLGIISTLNEYIAFRNAHGINDNSYNDLYLGDYFTVQDGTYNAVWMVAHFDYYYNRGADPSTEHPDRVVGSRGVVLIPRSGGLGKVKMNLGSNVTTGGYKESLGNIEHCPHVAAAMQTLFGSYLLYQPVMITNEINANMPSMAGANKTGAAVNVEWTNQLCIMPSEINIYGSSIFGSSAYDNFAYPQKLAVFNFISPVEYSRYVFWLRSVATNAAFALSDNVGIANCVGAASSYGLRPLIYIG